jgi:type II secretory pathway pseudopilin PulG
MKNKNQNICHLKQNKCHPEQNICHPEQNKCHPELVSGSYRKIADQARNDKRCSGFTIVEALIAITVLTIIVAAIFSVLTTSLRSVKQPTVREESVLAIEKASDLLKIYVDKDVYEGSYSEIPSDYQNGLCHDDGITDTTPMSVAGSPHNIACLIPDVCRTVDSTFTYTVSTETVNGVEYKYIDFDIDCVV